MIYIGIDNGVSGTIAFLGGKDSVFERTPVKKEQNYTKTKANITRIDFSGLIRLVKLHVSGRSSDAKAMIERPMVNPKRFKATTSALRSLEATINVLEYINIPYEYIDSKEWQSVFLPGVKGSENLKEESKKVGIEFYPQFRELIEKHGDADGLLIAKYLEMKNENIF